MYNKREFKNVASDWSKKNVKKDLRTSFQTNFVNGSIGRIFACVFRPTNAHGLERVLLWKVRMRKKRRTSTTGYPPTVYDANDVSVVLELNCCSRGDSLQVKRHRVEN